MSSGDREPYSFPHSRANRARKKSARTGMSSGRSRSGGTRIGKTERRKKRALRNLPAATSSSSALFVAQMIRTHPARRAGVVDGPLYQLLPGPRFAGKEDRRIEGQHAGHLLLEPLHRGALEDERLSKVERLLVPGRPETVRRAQVLDLQDPADVTENFVRLERFEEVILRAGLHRVHGGPGGALGGHQHHGEA